MLPRQFLKGRPFSRWKHLSCFAAHLSEAFAGPHDSIGSRNKVWEQINNNVSGGWWLPLLGKWQEQVIKCAVSAFRGSLASPSCHYAVCKRNSNILVTNGGPIPHQTWPSKNRRSFSTNALHVPEQSITVEAKIIDKSTVAAQPTSALTHGANDCAHPTECVSSQTCEESNTLNRTNVDSPTSSESRQHLEENSCVRRDIHAATEYVNEKKVEGTEPREKPADSVVFSVGGVNSTADSNSNGDFGERIQRNSEGAFQGQEPERASDNEISPTPRERDMTGGDSESWVDESNSHNLPDVDKEQIRIRSAARRALARSSLNVRGVVSVDQEQSVENRLLGGESPINANNLGAEGAKERREKHMDIASLAEAPEDEKLEYKRRAAHLTQAILGGLLDGRRVDEDNEENLVKVIPESEQRSLRIGIIGAPNAGKSVLANTLVGSKISAVSRKTNTTRMEILGVSTKGDTQLLFYDTPGVAPENPNHPLRVKNRRMMSHAWRVMEDCELLILLVDAERQTRMPDRRVERLMQRVGSELRAGQRRIACLNKVDLLRDKRLLLPLAQRLQELYAFERVFMISGLKGSGMRELEKHLQDAAVLRPWEEDPSRVTTQSQTQLAVEIVRECIFDRLHQELPYTVEQLPLSHRRLSDGSLRIEQVLLVANETQRAVVVGSQGETIRQIGIAARKQLETIFNEKVHLVLQVKSARKR